MDRNLTMMTDLYQLTMMYGYHRHGTARKEAVFDLFFRYASGRNTYALTAGLEQVMAYIDGLAFSPEDVAYLRSLHLFDEDFLGCLPGLRFTGELYAMPEGTVAFPGEPLVRVRAPLIEAQLIETALLNIVNHQTLIATKASRVVYAAQGDGVLEFGLRRAQGPDAGIYGARAAMVGGCMGTSNVLTGQMYGVPIKGTHAHSWVMSFPDELTAFRAYAGVFPDTCLLLVDTYDTLRSGVPNAIRVFEELRAAGHEPVGIRLDSGDLAYLSKKARAMMDAAGFPGAKIFASNDLDEHLIWDLKAQGAAIDVWGVGTKLITSDENPSLGGVYKMSALEQDGVLAPRMKVSDNPEKMTTPGYKTVYRLYDRDNGMAIADLITLAEETLDDTKPLVIFDPEAVWKRMEVTHFTARELLVPVYKGGKKVYESPALADIQRHARQSLAAMWDEYRRLNNPHHYKVDLSNRLYDLKQKLLLEQSARVPR